MPGAITEHGELDVAIVGAGAAGTYLAYRLIQARPDWRIAIFERSHRIGGRLWSMHVDGLSHPIELGGMRYMSGHPLLQSVVNELEIETRAFDSADQPERTVLRARSVAVRTIPMAAADTTCRPAKRDGRRPI